MKKSQKWLLAVLCVVLCLCVFGACTTDHVHSYTEVGFDKTNHWKYCKADNVKDESSVTPHEYTETGSDDTNHWKYCKVDDVKDESTVEAHKDLDRNGKCDVCGHAVDVPAPVVKYGTLNGTVSLLKTGKTTASAEGVTIKVVDADGEVDVKDLTIDEATGAYSMQCPTGEYTLKIGKQGYDEAEYAIEITEDETVTMNVTLAYKVFMAAPKPGWDWELVDTAHANDQEPYFKVNYSGAGKTLDMVTCETFDDASFSVKVKRGYSANGEERFGVMAYFYNSELDRYEFAWLSVKGSDNCLEWVGMDLWDQIFTVKKDYWGFNGNGFSAEELAQYEAGTLEIGIARHENMLFALVNGQVRTTLVLDEKYANFDMRFGVMAYDVSSGDGKWYFNINDDISALLDNIGYYTVDIATTEHATITANRTKVVKGQPLELTVTADEGYEVVSLMVGNTDYASQINNGKLTLNNYGGEKITASVVSTATIDVEIAAIGLDGYEITFTKGETEHKVTVADGKAKFSGMAGVWQASFVYMGTVCEFNNVVVDSEGNGTLIPTIDIFDHECMAGWGDTVSSTHDVTTNSGTVTPSGTLLHKTIVSYDEVAITVYPTTAATGEYIGLTMTFGNEYLWFALFFDKDGNYNRVEWVSGSWFQSDSTPCKNIGDSTWNGFGKGDSWKVMDSDGNVLFQNGTGLTEDELAMLANGTLPMTLVRKGANVYAFINGRYVGMRNVGDERGARKVNVGLTNFGKKGDGQLSYKIETDISAYLAKCEGASNFKYIVNGDHVNVTGKTEGFNLNDIAEITLAVEEGFTVTSFKVDGVECDFTANFKKWLLDKDLANVTIDIQTVAYVPVTIDCTLKGTKGGYAGDTSFDLANGKVTLVNEEFTFELDLVDGAFSGKVAPGTYTVSYGDYITTTVTIDSEHATHELFVSTKNFESGDMFWNNQVAQSYTDGKATLTLQGDANTMAHQTTELFDNAAITLYADSTQSKEHIGTFVKFGNQFVWFYIKVDGTLEWNCNTWMSETIVNITEKTWNNYGPNSWWMCDASGNGIYQGGSDLTDEEKAMFAAGTLPLTLVRKGANVYAFINGKYIGMRNVGDEIGASKVTLGLTNFGAIANAKLSYLIETDISAYLAKCEGASSFKYDIKGDYYTVSGKTEGYNSNDFAEITIAANEGYVIKSAKIDGQNVEVSGTISLKRWVLGTALANVTIELEIEQIKDVTAQIIAEGLDGYELTFTNGEEQRTATVVDGEATFEAFVGTWNVQITYMGSKFDLGNAEIGTDGIVEINNKIALFGSSDILGWNNQITDKFDLTTGKGVANNVGSSNSLFHNTIATYDQVAVTQFVKQSNTEENAGVNMRFGQKFVWLCIKKDGSVEWNCNSWENFGIDNITEATYNGFGPNCWWICDSNGATMYQNGNNLTAEEMTMFAEGTLPITLVRNGANAYAFINGRYIGMRNVAGVLGEEVANGNVTAGIVCTGAKAGSTFNYQIETDISTYLAKCEGTSSFKYVVSGDNVKVTGNTEGYNVNDFAEITLEAEEGYTITSVKVNGVETDARSFKIWLLGTDIANVTIEVTTAANE